MKSRTAFLNPRSRLLRAMMSLADPKVLLHSTICSSSGSAMAIDKNCLIPALVSVSDSVSGAVSVPEVVAASVDELLLPLRSLPVSGAAGFRLR